MWYGAGITAAFTYYDGFNNIPTFKQYYVEDETTNYADFALEYGYYPKKGIGFECSVPFDQMNVKFDMTISDAFTTVDSTNLDVANAMVFIMMVTQISLFIVLFMHWGLMLILIQV